MKDSQFTPVRVIPRVSGRAIARFVGSVNGGYLTTLVQS